MVRYLPFLLIVSSLLARNAVALEFDLADLGLAGVEIVAAGPIAPGDVERLRGMVDQVPPDTPIAGLRIASPGGNVGEAEALAKAIRATRLPVTIGPGSDCASACFLIFAAATERRVAPNARVGVHSASVNGTDGLTAMAVTTELARRAGEYGVPADIVGKLVLTGPKQITWLSPRDLRAMGALPAR